MPEEKKEKEAKKVDKKDLKQNTLFGLNVVIRVLQSLFAFGVVLLLLGGALAAGIGAGYFAYLVEDTATPTKEELQRELGDITETSKMVYGNDETISTIRSDLMRTAIKSENISDLIKEAIISTEDEYFEEHNGIVPKAVIRALVSDTTGIGGSSGGSTLTQQLVKQQVLTDEVSFKRKANEILLAMQVEKFFTKDEIVTTYLNVSPFGRNNKGQNIAGVQEAAQGIFGVDAKDVNLPQAAFIAGLPQSPISYSPYTNTGAFKEDYSAGLARKDFVLFSMYRNKVLSEEEYQEAIDYDLAADFIQPEQAKIEDQGFLYTTIMEEAQNILAKENALAAGLSEEDYYQDQTIMAKYEEQALKEIQNGGYTIHSTIDKDIYNAMQDAVASYGYLLDATGSGVETGSVLMENSTGKVLGFIGSRDYNDNQNNHAFYTDRQTGSSIKPILVYGPAIDQGLIGSESKISNYDRTYNDPGKTAFSNATEVQRNTFISARDALSWSHNYPAVNLYDELRTQLGNEFVYDTYINKLNYPNDSTSWSLESAPLGTVETTTLIQTNAFQALANGGVYQEGYIIDSITNNAGDVIYQHEEDPIQVYSTAAASIMNDMMRSVLTSGNTTNFKSNISAINWALADADFVGKTGTTDDNIDNWLLISTPGVTLGTWAGRDDPSALGYLSPSVANYVANVVNQIYWADTEVFTPNQKFQLSSDVQKAKVSSLTGQVKGTFTYNGTTYTDNGSTIESLWIPNVTVPNSSYTFGVGGSYANYASYWKNKLTRPASSTNNNSNSNNNNNNSSNSNNSNNRDRDDDNSSNSRERDND